MIVGNIADRARFFSCGRDIEEALNFLAAESTQKLPAGRFVISENAYANVSEYTTLPAAELSCEFHRQYADIQYVVRGEEAMGWAPLAGCEALGDFQSERDVGFVRGKLSFVRLGAGDFSILYPEDAHQPKNQLSAPCAVKKIVVKIRLTGEKDSSREAFEEPSSSQKD